MNVRHDMVTVFVLRPGKNGHELLQLRRSPGDYMGGTWQTVRGVVEPGETAPQGALRELREETGLAPVDFFGLSSIDSLYTAKFETIWHCPVFVALAETDAQVRLNEEHDAFRWVVLRDTPPLLMWQRERELLSEIELQIIDGALAKEHLRIRI
jgi:dATP pyrophosphohydrolase